MVFPLTNVF